MATKRGRSPELVGNPFIKKRNLEWSLDDVISVHGSEGGSDTDESEENGPGAQAVEAGQAKIEDHLAYFSGLLAKATLTPFPPHMPRFPIEGYRKLYEINSGNPRGAHFIIHQHDHPIAGTHYDLRLQINETSSASWAIMYGLPGDPNSQRLNRNATETRIHCLWNHLIETASASTGSLLIWDTGTYTVLPTRETGSARAISNSQSSDEGEDSFSRLTEQEKLHQGFQMRKIRIRLNGTRLPHNYVLNLRLTKDEDAAGRAKSARTPTRRRRRGGFARGRGRGGGKAVEPVTSSDSDSDRYTTANNDESEVVNAPAEETAHQDGISAMEREIRELEDEQVRRTNAYAGATNSIGSIHQRRWYLSLDRAACGFVKRRPEVGAGGRALWTRPETVNSKSPEKSEKAEEVRDRIEDRLTFPFYVRGVEVERSVVTGRTGADVLKNEGVEGYVGRKGWRPVLN